MRGSQCLWLRSTCVPSRLQPFHGPLCWAGPGPPLASRAPASRVFVSCSHLGYSLGLGLKVTTSGQPSQATPASRAGDKLCLPHAAVSIPHPTTDKGSMPGLRPVVQHWGHGRTQEEKGAQDRRPEETAGSGLQAWRTEWLPRPWGSRGQLTAWPVTWPRMGSWQFAKGEGTWGWPCQAWLHSSHSSAGPRLRWAGREGPPGRRTLPLPPLFLSAPYPAPHQSVSLLPPPEDSVLGLCVQAPPRPHPMLLRVTWHRCTSLTQRT